MDEKRIANLMKSLDLTREQAIEMIKSDEEIDKMSMKEVNNDLSKEQKAVVKEMKNSGTKKPKAEYTFTKRERKPDEQKIDIIKQIAEYLADSGYTEVNISNPSKVIDFTIDNVKFSLNLTRHRAEKK